MPDPAIVVKYKRIIVDPNQMEVDKYYDFKYEGRLCKIVKGESGKLYIYDAKP